MNQNHPSIKCETAIDQTGAHKEEMLLSTNLLFFTLLAHLVKGKLYGGVPSYILYVNDRTRYGMYNFLLKINIHNLHKIVLFCMMAGLPKESRATLACLYKTSGRYLMLYIIQLIIVDFRHYTAGTQPTVVRLHRINEQHLYQDRIRMRGSSDILTYWKGSWASID